MKSGEIKIEAQYQDLQYAFGDYYIAKNNNKYGIINVEEQIVLQFEYEKLEYQKKAGLIIAQKQNNPNIEILDNNLEKKLEGTQVEMNTTKSYIRMKTNNEYKYYNFNLEETKIGNVGKYHLAEDFNSYYYTDAE